MKPSGQRHIVCSMMTRHDPLLRHIPGVQLDGPEIGHNNESEREFLMILQIA